MVGPYCDAAMPQGEMLGHARPGCPVVRLATAPKHKFFNQWAPVRGPVTIPLIRRNHGNRFLRK